ncbi:MAG: hypothetical protein P8X81_10935 [Woeseiaceae bacterium]|jgi:hypothetical protein
MNSEKLHDWLQIIGMAAVVASLIFVGLQLKQSQEIAVADQYQARFESIAGITAAFLQSDAAMRVFGEEVRGEMLAKETLAPGMAEWIQDQPSDELAYRALFGMLRLKIFDNLYFQYESGFLSEEAWSAYREEFRIELGNPQLWTRAIFEHSAEIWRESFQGLVKELLQENELVDQ